LEKELALLHRRALLIALLQEVASDLRPDVSIDQTVKRTNPLRINWNIFLLNLRHLDIRSAGRRTHSLLVRPKGSNNQSEHDQAKNSADQQNAFLDLGHVSPPILLAPGTANRMYWLYGSWTPETEQASVVDCENSV